jgi:hypothetical protein
VNEMSETVIAEIAAERKRQIEKEGWSPEHDDEHTRGELSQAAACYALEATKDNHYRNGYAVPVTWPDEWHIKWWKPKDRRRDLVRAAALIVAEIERLDRTALSKANPPENGQCA